MKANRYKTDVPPVDKSGIFDAGAADFCLKWGLTVAFVSILSLASIFAYDIVTQSTWLNVRQIQISGNNRVSEQEIISLTQLKEKPNIFKLNLQLMEKKLDSHPWIQKASVKRDFSATLFIKIIEHEPLAIVKIENIADIVINIQGYPFKEYNPSTDRLENLPVITGLDLTQAENAFIFDGPLFNSIMDFLNMEPGLQTLNISADLHTGLTIKTSDIKPFNPLSVPAAIPIKLGFNDFDMKLNKAKKISTYVYNHFPDKQIIAMDLFNPKKVFIKTKQIQTVYDTSEKGA